MFISDRDGALDRVEVACDVVSWAHVELFSLPELLVHHLEAIGIVPQLAVRVEVVEELPVEYDILASLVLV